MEQSHSVCRLKKQLADKEREVASLHREVFSLKSCKEQQPILEQQLKLLRNKLSYYETALAENQVWSSQHFYEESGPTVQRLESELTSLMRTHAQVLSENEALKGQIATSEDSSEVVQALESDNHRLRNQLSLVRDSLEQCQEEVNRIPVLQQKLKGVQGQLRSLEFECNQERSLRQELQAEKTDIADSLLELHKLAKGRNPEEYLLSLERQVAELTDEVDELQNDVQVLEQQQQLDTAEQAAREKQLVLAVRGVQDILQSDADWDVPPVQCPVAHQLAQLATAVTAYKDIVDEQHTELNDTCISLEEQLRQLQVTVEVQQSKLTKLEDERDALQQKARAYTQLEFALNDDPVNSIQALKQTIQEHETTVQQSERTIQFLRQQLLTNQQRKAAVEQQAEQTTSRLTDKLKVLIQENEKLAEAVMTLESVIKDLRKSQGCGYVNWQGLAETGIQLVHGLIARLELHTQYKAAAHRILQGQAKRSQQFRLRAVVLCILAAKRLSSLTKSSYFVTANGFRVPLLYVPSADCTGVPDLRLLQCMLPRTPHTVFTADLFKALVPRQPRSSASPLVQYQRLNFDLQESVLELHAHIDSLSTKNAQLLADNRAKTQHIQSLEVTLTKMNPFSDSTQLLLCGKTQLLNDEVVSLSDSLEKIMQDYTILLKKYEDSSAYIDELTAILNERTRQVQVLEEEAAEARLQAEIAGTGMHLIPEEFTIDDVSQVDVDAGKLTKGSSLMAELGQ